VHRNDPQHRRRAIPIRQAVGVPILKSCFQAGGLISAPNGFPAVPDAFKNKCLLSSIALGYLKFTSKSDYEQIKASFVTRSLTALKNVAGQMLLSEMEKICHNSNVTCTGPNIMEEILPLITESLKIQIHVITSMDGQKPGVMSYPSKNNWELPRIYLYLQSDNHIVFIDNLKAFFTLNRRFICLDCNRFYSFNWKRSTHRCTNQKHCFNCNGVIETSDKTVTVQNEIITFCDSKLENNQVPSFSCQKCNLSFSTLRCYTNHQKQCLLNQAGYRCTTCLCYMQLNGKSIEDVKKAHDCNTRQKRCQFCFQMKEKDHICKLKPQVLHKSWPNLCIVNMKFKYLGSSNCQNCYDIREKYVTTNNITFPQLFKLEIFSELICHNHKNISENPAPNVICCFVEQTTRHNFKEFIFCDDQLDASDSLSEETFAFAYSETARAMTKEAFKLKCSKQNVSAMFDAKLKSLPRKTALLKFLIFICSGNFRNYVFVMNDGKAMLAVLEGLLKMDLVPSVVQRGHKIQNLELSSLQVSFVNILSYLDGSIYEMARQYAIEFEPTYFPDGWNQEQFYDYAGGKPLLSDFFHYLDSTTEKSYIQLSYESMPAHWKMRESLMADVKNQTLIFTKAVLSFMKQAFHLQQKCSEMTGKSTEAIHPFGWKVISLSGFTFAIAKYYFLDEHDLFSIMSPYSSGSTRTSQGEYEYMTYLNWF